MSISNKCFVQMSVFGLFEITELKYHKKTWILNMQLSKINLVYCAVGNKTYSANVYKYSFQDWRVRLCMCVITKINKGENTTQCLPSAYLYQQPLTNTKNIPETKEAFTLWCLTMIVFLCKCNKR